MTLTTLVTGATAVAREDAIAGSAKPDLVTALILEGLPGNSSRLDALVQSSSHLFHIVRIAPGCLCCTGNLTMRVMLNRMLRLHPRHLYIGLATSAHLDNIRAFLRESPYNNLLELTKDLQA